MKRIREDELKEVLKEINHRNLKIQMQGILKQENFMKDVDVRFLNNDIEFEIKDKKTQIIFNLSFIEEIYFLEKNKLKFLINHDLEILITFL